MNGVKRTPLRTCVGCRSQKAKKDLIRIVRADDGSIGIDPTGKKNGRGAYVCREKQCLMDALKNHSLEKSFKCRLSAETAAQLLREMEQFEE